MRWRVLLPGAALAAAACGNTEAASPPSHDGGAADAVDASSVQHEDSGSDGATCASDAGIGVPCAQTLGDYCTGDAGPYATWPCSTTWQGVQANPPCAASGGCPYAQVLSESCIEIQEVWLASIDTGIGAAYATQSGQLVAVLWNSDGVISCAAGPPCFALPDCTGGQALQCCPSDAGGD